MAGRLLLVVLMYSFHKIQTQGTYQPQPKLIMNSPVITETETVTLDCQTSSSVPVKHCYFYTVGRGNTKGFSCLQTLTGTELLRMSQQRSPAEVQVKCYYTVKRGDIFSPSPHSDTSSITIQSQPPQLSLHHFDGEVVFTCSLPGSANKDTRCNLYFGEESHPVKTNTIWKKRSSKNQWFCQFTVTIDDLLRRLHFLQRSDASCDYSLGSEPNSLSPRSDRSSLNDIVKKESSMTSTDSAFTKNKDLTDSRSTASTFGITGKPVSDVVESSTTQTKPASTMTTDIVKKESSMTSTDSAFTKNKDLTDSRSTASTFGITGKPVSEKFTLMIGGGVTVGVLLLGLALLLNQSRIERCVSKRPNGLQVDYDETYSIVTYSTNCGTSAAPERDQLHQP